MELRKNPDRYLPRGSNGNALCITTTGNVFVVRWVKDLLILAL